MEGLARENTLQEAGGIPPQRIQMGREWEVGGETSTLSVIGFMRSNLAFGIFSQFFCVSISWQFFNIYAIQGILHALRSWHGQCSICSLLDAFRLRTAP